MLCHGWVPYLVENKKILMVGIPGVGKSTLLTTMVEILKDHKKNVIVINYGTLMFDVAKENGLENRDDLRRLSVTEQQRLQKNCCRKNFYS